MSNPFVKLDKAATVAELIEQRFGVPTQAGKAVPASANATISGMLTRRSMRRFTPQPVAPGAADHDSAASRPPVCAVNPAGTGGGDTHDAVVVTTTVTCPDGALTPEALAARTRTK